METKTTRLMLVLPEDLKKASQEKAKSMGLSTSAWIRLVLMDKLKEDEMTSREDEMKSQVVKTWNFKR